MIQKFEDIVIYDKMGNDVTDFSYELTPYDITTGTVHGIMFPERIVVWAAFPDGTIQELPPQTKRSDPRETVFPTIIPPRLPPDSDRIALTKQILLHMLPSLLTRKFRFENTNKYNTDAEFLVRAAIESTYCLFSNRPRQSIVVGKQHYGSISDAFKIAEGLQHKNLPFYNLERRTHFIDGVPDGVAIFLPDPEFLGCWTIFPDDTKGLFMLENDVQAAQFIRKEHETAA